MASRFIYKPKSLCRLFSGLMSVPDVDNGTAIDDWEISVVSDEEDHSTDKLSDIFSEKGDDSFMPFPFHYLNSNTKIKYTILSKEEVFQYLQDKISRISSVFLLPTSEAAMILHHFKWNVLETENRWLLNEESVRKAVGLFKRPVTTIVSPTEHRACEICSDNSPSNLLGVVSCGHQFCTSCWTGYISIAICGGPSCLTLRCPSYSCDAAVEWDFIKLLSSEDDKKKFEQYIIESCLLGDIELKWCPGPGCECAVFLIAEGDENTVTCNCSYSFCWNCCKEVHAPVDCGTADKWMAEIALQLENQRLANSEPFPTCNCVVLRNQSGPSSSHDSFESSSSCMNWSQYEAPVSWESWAYDVKIPNVSDNYEKFVIESDIAKVNFQRYIQYCEEWITYESLRLKASENVKILDPYIDILSCKFDLPKNDINFIVDAQLQLVECYQVLRWLCVYDYYMSMDETNKKNLFTILLEEAKNLMERLKKQVEELDLILGVDVSRKEFRDFRIDLITRTRVTRKYYANMVDGLRAGLPEATSNVEQSQEEMDRDLKMVKEDGPILQHQPPQAQDMVTRE